MNCHAAFDSFQSLIITFEFKSLPSHTYEEYPDLSISVSTLLRFHDDLARLNVNEQPSRALIKYTRFSAEAIKLMRIGNGVLALEFPRFLSLIALRRFSLNTRILLLELPTAECYQVVNTTPSLASHLALYPVTQHIKATNTVTRAFILKWDDM